MCPIGAMFFDMRQVGIDNRQIFLGNSERLDIFFVSFPPRAYFHRDKIGLADDKDMKILESFAQGNETLLKIRAQIIQEALHSIIDPFGIKIVALREILYRFIKGLILIIFIGGTFDY